MAALPYMQLFVADYKADTEHLTTVEHGAYLLLLMNYWQTGKPLPDDDLRLAAIARMPQDQWIMIRPVIGSFFEITRGSWRHKRIDKDLAKVRDKQEQASRAGKASGNARSNARSNGSSTNEDPDTESDTDQKRKPPLAPQGGTDLFGDSPNGERYCADFEAWWAKYPNKTGKRKAALAFVRAKQRILEHGAYIDAAAFLMARLAAQKRVWTRDGTEREFIPHGATWLNQARYDDDRVGRSAAAMDNPPPKQEEQELSPSTPKPEPRATYGVVGWSPDDEQER